MSKTIPPPKCGDMFGRLKVVWPLGWARYSTEKKLSKHALVVCTCKPREERVMFAVPLYRLRTSHNTSCGCIRLEQMERGRARRAAIKRHHGESKTPLWNTWVGMKGRCHRQGHKDYRYYGAKGITVWAPWRASYPVFRDWMLEHCGQHPGPGWEIDRIDPRQGYQPGNVRWLTRTDNARRHSNSRWVTFQGQQMTVSQAAVAAGLPPSTVIHRITRGWPRESWFTPARKRQRRA